MPLNILYSDKLPIDSRNVALPPCERKQYLFNALSNTILVQGL